MSERVFLRRAGPGAPIAAALLLALLLGRAAGAQAPRVDWQRGDWFPSFPPLTATPQSQGASGEDWWNHHTNSYDASNTLQGYIAAGFSSFVNYNPQESFPGCLSLHLGTADCNEFEVPGTVLGAPEATMALIKPDGTAYSWFKAYDEGEFFRVIQTSDGGYLATGYTASTTTLDGTQPLYYNPGQTPLELTDSFRRGDACSPAGAAQAHATLVKTDANGNVQWHYLYGMEPYRNGFGPDPDEAYELRGTGWGITEAANGDFIMVGEVADRWATFSCGTNNNGLTRAVMIEVTPQGLWVSGRYLEPAAVVPTNATAIDKYQDPSGAFHYVISGTSFFQSSDPTSINGYTGCGLYQKVFVQQIDDTASRAHEWEVTNFNQSSSLFQTSSQNTFDVQIARYSTYSTSTQSYASHTDILLPAIVDCKGCLYSGFNQGTGMIYRLASTGSGSPPGTLLGPPAKLPRTLTAFDLRMRATPTADGGFAAVSTVQPSASSATPPTPVCNSYDTSSWNTDAYVARFDPSGGLLWDKSFPNAEPFAGPTVFPSDWKFQECLYSISQSQDGGFVVAGNDSYNFDDDYVAKLTPEAPPAGPAGPDLIIRDTPLDTGLEPNPDTGPMWVSSDIWVRLLNDGGLVHQNPEYSAGGSNWVYTRITNLGTTPKTATLKVYWAKASTGLSWPNQWSSYTVGSTLFGDLVGSMTVTVPAATSSGAGVLIVPMQWNTVPNPADFASFGADQSHFCLLARIETQTGGTFGMTYPETTDVVFNTRNNDKIAWKNVSVVVPFHKSQEFVTVRNVAAEARTVRLAFGVSKTSSNSPRTLLDDGTIDVLLGPSLYQRWVKGGRVGRGVKEIRGQRIRLVHPNASIGNLRMAPEEMETISLMIDSTSLPPLTREIDIDVLQYSTARRTETLVGGQRFTLSPPPRCGGDLKLAVNNNTNHWRVTEVPAALTGVPATPYPPHAVPGGTFGFSFPWITAVSSQDAYGPGGFYTYQYQFCLCEGFSNPALSLNLVTDNEATVQLNGANTIGTTLANLTPATISATPAQGFFKTGNNVLTIRVRNRGVGGDPAAFTPTGLSVNGTITATAGRCSAGSAQP